jgi:large conductance mechanosensitive channel
VETVQGFLKFVIRGNVVGLAVGVVIGAAFSAMVSAFVGAFLTPVVGWATGHVGDYSAMEWHLGQTVIRYGVFLNAALAFVLTAAALYFLIVLPINKITEELNPHHDLSKSKRACPECLTQVPALARRCSACTSLIAPIEDEDSASLIEAAPGEIALTASSAAISIKAPEMAGKVE